MTDNEQHQRRIRNLLLKGTRALQAQDWETAVRLLERGLQLQPDHLDLLLNLSGAYILSKKFKQAIPLLETALTHHPTNAMLWTNLGAAYLGNPILAKPEDQARAIQAFQQALEQHPHAPNVAYNIGLIYRDQHNHATALHWFERALETNPQDKDARHYATTMRQKLKDEG